MNCNVVERIPRLGFDRHLDWRTALPQAAVLFTACLSVESFDVPFAALGRDALAVCAVTEN